MMETEAKEKRKRRVKREEGLSRANRIAERERGGGRCHGWIPVDYDRNNGIRIIRFMRTDDTYNRPIIITLGKELQWRLKVRWKMCVNRSRSGIRASRDASLETIEGGKEQFYCERGIRIVYKIIYKTL